MIPRTTTQIEKNNSAGAKILSLRDDKNLLHFNFNYSIVLVYFTLIFDNNLNQYVLQL